MRRAKRRRSERQHPDVVVVRSSVVALVVAGLIYVALTAASGLPLESTYRIDAQFADAKNVVKNSEVWISGRRVGTVLGGDAVGHTSTLRLSLESDVDPLPVDTSARVRYTSLLGALIVELTPGRSRATLVDGATIPTSQTSTAEQTTDVLSAFDEKRRPEVATTLRELGTGFAGQGTALNDALRQSDAFFSDSLTSADSVLQRTGAAARFFPSLGRLSGAADPVREDIAEGFDPQATVLDALEPESVDRLLRTTPQAFIRTRDGLARTDPLLSEAVGFSRAAVRALRPSSAAFDQTADLLRDARDPVGRTEAVLRDAQRIVDPVVRLAKRGDRLAPRLREGLTTPVPLMTEFNRYRCDFLTWARNWRSMLAYGPKGSPVDSDVGPLTGLRVQVEQIGTDQQIAGQQPVNRRRVNAYPEPCSVHLDKVP